MFKKRLEKRKELKTWYDSKLGRTREEWDWYKAEWKKVQWIWEKIGTWLYYEVWIAVIKRYIVDPIIRLPRQVRWAYQRTVRGWCYPDTWCFSVALAPKISSMLKYYKKVKSGYPCVFKTMKEWDKIVDKMIYSWELAEKIGFNDVEYIPLKYWAEKEVKIIRNAWKITNKEMKKKLPNYENHKILTKKEAKKYEDGMKLFIEYLYNLWD